MPCMGPDCNAAREQGKQVAEALLAKLIADHHLWDISDKDIEATWLIKRNVDRWVGTKETIVEAIADLFVQDACNSF